MTRRAEGLMEVYGSRWWNSTPRYARRLGVNGNKRVRVASRRASSKPKPGSPTASRRAWYANFHFLRSTPIMLTIAALDPIAKIPEYKICASKSNWSSKLHPNTFQEPTPRQLQNRRGDILSPHLSLSCTFQPNLASTKVNQDGDNSPLPRDSYTRKTPPHSDKQDGKH
jgi:hypothetical protein